MRGMLHHTSKQDYTSYSRMHTISNREGEEHYIDYMEEQCSYNVEKVVRKEMKVAIKA